MATHLRPIFHACTYASRMSSTVLSVGMLTVLEMAPLMKGCAAPIIFR